MNANRLAIGTAQFGMDYGIANTQGKVKDDEVALILNRAIQDGVHMLDTAVGYGDSESVLGHAGINEWQVITKLPGLPLDCDDVCDWVRRTVIGSLQRLETKSLYAVLLHRPRQLTGGNGEALYRGLQGLRGEGLCAKVGLSINGPEDLDLLLPHFAFDIVQAPFNVFDRRIETTGWLDSLVDAGVEVHARSAFLQGLLLLAATSIPVGFERWKETLELWRSWLVESGREPLEACLSFVLSHPEIAHIVVGVDSAVQLEQILTVMRNLKSEVPPQALASPDPDLVEPSRWRA
jgi:aryl-alcohol dehydrogenase-like predicted oxidoreductase